MSAPIGPGDWVEYVGGKDPEAISVGWLSLGGLYVVAAVTTAPGLSGKLCPALILEGWRGRWTVKAFRPVYRPNAELLADLLRRAKEPLRTETPEPVA